MNSKNDAKPSIAAIQWRNLAEGLGWEGTPAELGAGLARLKQRAAYRRGRYDEVPTYYPVMCAWCQAEGSETRTRWTTVEHSHGICEACEKELMSQIIAEERMQRYAA